MLKVRLWKPNEENVVESCHVESE